MPHLSVDKENFLEPETIDLYLNNVEPSDFPRELRDRVEDLLLYLYKRYNSDRSKMLRIEPKQYFHPTAILGARLYPYGFGYIC